MSIGAVVALVTGIIVLICLVVDEWNVDRAGWAIVALAAAVLMAAFPLPRR